jgi:hypothetical protein
VRGGWHEGKMQTTAPHNVESDAIQLSDEHRAVDVPLSFVHFSSPSFSLSIHHHNQTDVLSTYIINSESILKSRHLRLYLQASYTVTT